MSVCTPRIGVWAAMLSLLFAACFSIVALTANFTTLIPAIWVNPLSFAPSLLLAWSYLALMACALAFAPRSFMLSLNGLAYGLMSASAFLAAFAFPGHANSFVRRALWAHGAMAPIVIAAIFWPAMVYLGALWIVTFPAMALALADVFARRARHG